MRLVFLGTPESAAICLRALVREKFDIAAVLTRPDRPKGRFLHLAQSPVKKTALENELKVLEHKRASSTECIAELRAIEPDIIVVVAFGEILSDDFLSIPKSAIVNVHFSLLPKYRGAAPVHWALINGEAKTGVTIQHLAKKLDTGDIILQEEMPIDEEDNVETLLKKLATAGAKLLIRALRQLEEGKAPRIPQDESQATYARKLRKDDGKIDWRLAADAVANHVRGMTPWPGAYTFIEDKDKLKMLKIAHARPLPTENGRPGEVLRARDKLVVAAGEGAIDVLVLQLEGKRRMQAEEFLRGHRVGEGTLLR